MFECETCRQRDDRFPRGWITTGDSGKPDDCRNSWWKYTFSPHRRCMTDNPPENWVLDVHIDGESWIPMSRITSKTEYTFTIQKRSEKGIPTTSDVTDEKTIDVSTVTVSLSDIKIRDDIEVIKSDTSIAPSGNHGLNLDPDNGSEKKKVRLTGETDNVEWELFIVFEEQKIRDYTWQPISQNTSIDAVRKELGNTSETKTDTNLKVISDTANITTKECDGQEFTSIWPPKQGWKENNGEKDIRTLEGNETSAGDITLEAIINSTCDVTQVETVETVMEKYIVGIANMYQETPVTSSSA